MGVKDLWGILKPVQRHVRLEDLRGKTLAVDLSIWVVEVQGMKQLQAVHKPHLRNLFFRVHKLLQLGILPVFALEGEPPPLKYEAMMKRVYGLAYKTGTVPPKKMGRSHFKSKLKECAEMLRYMGVPCVQSVGEAEAFCAFLNKCGLVDACITEDGDAFLYGARTVYRNFTINVKDPSVEIYEMDDIEMTLGLTQDNLVAMGLLLGCDFLPKGLPGVGREMCLKLLNSLPSVNILQRMKQWRSLSLHDIQNTKLRVKEVVHCDNCQHPGTTRDHTKTGCALCGTSKDCTLNQSEDSCPCHWHVAKVAVVNRSAELAIYKKAIVDPKFPDKQVISEFLTPKDKRPPGGWSWIQPMMFQMQEYGIRKLDWEEKYTQEKMLPLLTLWTLRQIKKKGRSVSGGLKPHRIVKCRVHRYLPVYEVEWHKCEGDTTSEESYYVTIEEQELFSQCFPDLTLEFTERCETEAALKGKSRKKKATKDDKTSQNKENEKPAKKVDNLVDYIPISQLNMKDTLAELGVNYGIKTNEDTYSDFSQSKISGCPPDRTAIKDDISHTLSSKQSTFGVKAASFQKSTVVDISSDEDDFLPVSQLVSKTKDVKKKVDYLASKTKAVEKKVHDLPRFLQTNHIAKSACNDSQSDSDDGMSDFLPLSQRVVMNMKKAASKPKIVEPKKCAEDPGINAFKDTNVIETKVSAGCRLEKTEKPKSTSAVLEGKPLPVERTEPKAESTCKPRVGKDESAFDAFQKSELGPTKALYDPKVCGVKSEIKQEELLQEDYYNTEVKVAQLETKPNIKESSCEKGANIPDSNVKESPSNSVKEESRGLKKLPKKKKLTVAGKKKKKKPNFDALHGDLEMLCMDSMLGDITTGNLNQTSCTSEAFTTTERNKLTQKSCKSELVNHSNSKHERSSMLSAKTRSSRLHDLTFSDIQDEIISGAAEIFDEDLENVSPYMSACPTKVKSPIRQTVISCGNNTSAIPRAIGHDMTVWDQDQKGQFDLGLSLDFTMSSMGATKVEDMSAESTTLQHTIYTESCLSRNFETLAITDADCNDNTTVNATAVVCEDAESTLQADETRAFVDTVLEKDLRATLLQSETLPALVCNEVTVNYVGNRTKFVDGASLYNENTCHEMDSCDFTAPEYFTVNTPNITCIDTTVRNCSLTNKLIASLPQRFEESVVEKEVTYMSATLANLCMEDNGSFNSTCDSLATVVEVDVNTSLETRVPDEIERSETAPVNQVSMMSCNNSGPQCLVDDTIQFQVHDTEGTTCRFSDKTAIANNNNNVSVYHVDDTIQLNGDCGEDNSPITCDNTVIELNDSIQNDSDFIPPSPMVLSQRLGSRLQSSQLRTLSIFSQSSQKSGQETLKSELSVSLDDSGNDSDVVFLN